MTEECICHQAPDRNENLNTIEKIKKRFRELKEYETMSVLLQCQRCGYKWYSNSRSVKNILPIRCAKCSSPFWKNKRSS